MFKAYLFEIQLHFFTPPSLYKAQLCFTYWWSFCQNSAALQGWSIMSLKNEKSLWIFQYPSVILSLVRHSLETPSPEKCTISNCYCWETDKMKDHIFEHLDIYTWKPQRVSWFFQIEFRLEAFSQSCKFTDAQARVDCGGSTEKKQMNGLNLQM